VNLAFKYMASVGSTNIKIPAMQEYLAEHTAGLHIGMPAG